MTLVPQGSIVLPNHGSLNLGPSRRKKTQWSASDGTKPQCWGGCYHPTDPPTRLDARPWKLGNAPESPKPLCQPCRSVSASHDALRSPSSPPPSSLCTTDWSSAPASSIWRWPLCSIWQPPSDSSQAGLRHSSHSPAPECLHIHCEPEMMPCLCRQHTAQRSSHHLQSCGLLCCLWLPHLWHHLLAVDIATDPLTGQPLQSPVCIGTDHLTTRWWGCCTSGWSRHCSPNSFFSSSSSPCSLLRSKLPSLTTNLCKLCIGPVGKGVNLTRSYPPRHCSSANSHSDSSEVLVQNWELLWVYVTIRSHYDVLVTA